MKLRVEKIRPGKNQAFADFYLERIHQAQQTAPFGDGQGLAASTLQDGDTLPPLEQCLSTPFQCIPERVGLAATAWAIFAELGRSPLGRPYPVCDVRMSQEVYVNGQTISMETVRLANPDGDPSPVNDYIAALRNKSSIGPA